MFQGFNCQAGSCFGDGLCRRVNAIWDYLGVVFKPPEVQTPHICEAMMSRAMMSKAL